MSKLVRLFQNSLQIHVTLVKSRGGMLWDDRHYDRSFWSWSLSSGRSTARYSNIRAL